ncbi:MAG: copper homeostasis protein CutC [Nocardioidaceae bacterium]|nr:copper homeostasis protein CutC [Nocardioidaceae bacterium]
MIEVVALHPGDAENAQEGGADRIQLCAWSNGESRSVEPAVVSAVVRAVDLPVRVTLRLSSGFTTSGGEFSRLVGLASNYLALGVEGFSFGFLTADLEIDDDVCLALVREIGDAPWTFDRVFDSALDANRAWRRVRQLPGLDGIHTSGAVRGMDTGFDDLLGMAKSDPTFAAIAIAAAGTRPEHVPWLMRAGITRLHLGAVVRPGGTWTKAHVDSGFVRSWRRLLDDAPASLARASGSAG